MAKATVQTVTVKTVTLTLSEDEAHAIFALTGAVASTTDSVTGDIYDTLSNALADEGEFYSSSNYSVGNHDGSYPGSLYLTKNK